mgnify:CR=1 FL=1
MRIAISGASGFIGAALARQLAAKGAQVSPLVRGAARPGQVAWDPAAATIDHAALEGTDAVIHLAGEPIAGGRWTAAKKAKILSSREQGTDFLCTALARLKRPPATLISASLKASGASRLAATITRPNPSTSSRS